jgi:hypothetical protein
MARSTRGDRGRPIFRRAGQQVQKYEKGAAGLELDACYSLQKFSTCLSLCFSTMNAVQPKTEVPVFAFLDTPYSLRLVEAFARMPDRPIQQRIVQLIEQISDSISAAVRQSKGGST